MKYDSDITSLIYSLNSDQRIQFKELIKSFKEDGEIDNEFTLGDIIESIDDIILYENEQNESREASMNGYTTIPSDKWGVHKTHCCNEHGCKYGDVDCPVVMDLIIQTYPCESCRDSEE